MPENWNVIKLYSLWLVVDVADSHTCCDTVPAAYSNVPISSSDLLRQKTYTLQQKKIAVL